MSGSIFIVPTSVYIPGEERSIIEALIFSALDGFVRRPGINSACLIRQRSLSFSMPTSLLSLASESQVPSKHTKWIFYAEGLAGDQCHVA